MYTVDTSTISVHLAVPVRPLVQYLTSTEVLQYVVHTHVPIWSHGIWTSVAFRCVHLPNMVTEATKSF
jgi:hypothetical protein